MVFNDLKITDVAVKSKRKHIQFVSKERIAYRLWTLTAVSLCVFTTMADYSLEYIESTAKPPRMLQLP